MANKGVNILIELPFTFSAEDAEKINADLLDFFEKKRNYGADYDKKERIKIKPILWSTNDK